MKAETHLLDGNADADRVDGALDQDPLVFIAADHNRRQQHLFALAVGGWGGEVRKLAVSYCS